MGHSRSSRAAKGLSSPHNDDHDEDEDDSLIHSRRKRQKVNYASIENNYDDMLDDDEEKPSDVDESTPKRKNKKPVVKDEDEDEEDEAEVSEENDDNDDNDYDNITRSRSSRNARSRRSPKPAPVKTNDEDEDASFNEDESESEGAILSGSESDSNQERRQLNRFISKEDDDDPFGDSDYEGSRRRSRRNKRKKASHSARANSTKLSKSRLRKLSYDDEEEDDDITANSKLDENGLEEELAELRDDSDNSPQRARSLRERKKNVNYTIPPPLSENVEELSTTAAEPTTPRRRNGVSTREWRLFPTGGPFGGGSVTSLFGKNYAGSGGNLLGAGGADSDSSDDEIIPVGGSSNKRNSISAPIGSINKTPKKKQQNADSDPLGVDMNIDFTEVGGLDNYINQLKEMVALPLLYPEVYQRFGITPPRGVLFHGPPGTGKTLMARALAASCSSGDRKITFFMRKGADCLSKWVGEAERQLRLLFEEAKKQQPSIIFFDEIDGLAPVRSSKQEQIHASIVSTMLALMDGMDNRGQVIVIGATNRPDAVDPALRRPGRFDREFYFPLPDLKAREEILGIHTRKWDPPLSKDFLSKVAHLTKGYGGADLRALCTEAALNSIQRRYPQIYASNDKLKIDPSTITVAARDFMKAIDKIIPSSARSTASGSSPLPENLVPLLGDALSSLTGKLDKLVPRVKTLSSLEEAQFVDPTEKDADGGFAKHEFIKSIETSRIHRPRLLISGQGGNGQQYIGSAVLNHLEGFNVQSLDLGALYGDSTRTAENAIIQSFIEARRHKPSIIYIPNIDIWYDILPESAKATLSGLLRSVSSNERILLLGVAENKLEHLDHGLKHLFGISDANFFELDYPSSEERDSFFNPLWASLQMPPSEYLDTNKKKRLEVLEKVVLTKKEESNDLKSFEKSDMRLKNTIKIKLSGLMDLFRNRYKKFKKPTIDPIFLIHLFESYPSVGPPLFTKDGDMIVEITTGKRYFNMDLDIIEERLWNGFYSEPKQFLRDIEMIYLDAVTSQDRERLIKGSEMFANAQVAVEEISTPDFIEQCKGLRQREAQRIREYEEEQARLKAIQEKEQAEATANGESIVVEDVTVTETDGQVLPTIIESVPETIDQEGDVVIADINGSVHVPLHVVPNVQNLLNDKPAVSNVAPISAIVQEPTPETIPPPIESEVDIIEKQEEVEPETEEEDEPLPPFEIDHIKLETAKTFLVSETVGLTVEYLEQVNAKLMDILWEDHHKWDRTDTVDKIIDEIAKIKLEFQ